MGRETRSGSYQLFQEDHGETEPRLRDVAKRTKRRRLAGVAAGLVLIAAVAAILGVVLTRDSKSMRNAKELNGRLSSAVLKDNTLVLDRDVLKAERTSETIKESLGDSNLVIYNAVVNPVTDEGAEVLRGEADLGGQRMSLKAELYYEGDKQHAIFRYREAKGNTLKLSQLDSKARDVVLSQTEAVISTDETDGEGTPLHLSHRVKPGLSVGGVLAFSDNPDLRLWNKPTSSQSVAGEVSLLEDAAPVDGLPVSGQAKPRWDLSAGCPPNFPLGKYVVLTSCKIDIYNRKKYYSIAATAIVTLPGSNPLNVSVAGTFDDKVLSIGGSASGAQWRIMKDNNDIVVNGVAMNFTMGAANGDFGWIAGQFDVKGSKFGLNTSLVATKTEKDFAVAAYPLKELNLQSMSASLPSIPVKQALVVLSTYAGSFTKTAGQPTTVQVLKGVNMFATLDITQVPAIQGLSKLGQSNTLLNMRGRVGKDDFELTAELDNLNVGDKLKLSKAALTISSIAPQISVTSVGEATVADSTLAFDTLLTFAKSEGKEDLKLRGNQASGTTWTVGGVELKEMSLTADLTRTDSSKSYTTSINIAATVQPKDIALRVEFSLDKAEGQKSAITLAGYLPGASPSTPILVNTLPGFKSVPADVSLTELAVIVANNAGQYTLSQSGGQSVEYVKGLNFYGTFDIAKSSQAGMSSLAGVLNAEGKPTIVKLAGHYGKDQSKLEASVTDLPVSSRVYLSTLDLVLNSKSPFLSVQANATAKLPPRVNDQLQNINFLTDVTFASDKWTLTGSSETVWQFGKTAVNTLRIACDVNVSGGKKVLEEATLTGRVVKSKLDLVVTVDLERDLKSDDKELAVVAYTADEFTLAKLPGFSKIEKIDSVVIDKAVFVIANYDGEYTFSQSPNLNPPSPSMYVHDGLTFTAAADITALPMVSSLPGDAAVPPNVVVSAVIGDEVQLNATVGDLKVSDKVTLKSAKLQILSTEPHFALTASVSATLPGNDKPTLFNVAGVISDKDWSLSGDIASPWIVKLGKKTLTIEAVTLSLSNKPKPPVSGKITGKVVINDKTTISISVAYPSPANSKGVQIEGRFDGAVTLGDALKPIGSASWSTKNPIAKTLTTTTFTGAAVRIETSPPSFQVAGAMTIFGDQPLRVGAAAFQKGDAWGFSAGVALGQDFKFSAITSAAKPLEDFQFAQAKLVLTTVDITSLDLFLDGTSVTTIAGLVFDARLPLQGGGLPMIKKWTNVDAVQVQAQFATSAKEFSLRAGIEGRFKITKDVAITGAGLFLRVAPAKLEVGLDATVQTTLSKRPQDSLEFYGSIFVAPDGAGFETRMNTPWREPYGAKGLTILQSAVTMKFSYAAGLPTRFGIAGGLRIGNVEGSAAIYADLVNIQQSMVRGELKNIDLGRVIAATTNFIVPNTLSKTTTKFGFERLLVYANMGTSALRFNNQVYAPGYKFEVDDFNFFNVIRGSCKVNIFMDKGIDMSGSLAPFTLGNVLSVSGFEGPKSNATVAVKLMRGSPPAIGVSGAVTLFKVANLAVKLNFSDAAAVGDVQFKTSIFNFRLYLAAEGQMPKPTDFVFSGEINNELHKYLAEKIPNALKGFIDDTNKEYNDLMSKHNQKLAELQAKIDKKEAELAVKKKEEQSHLEKPQQKLHSAITKLERARAKVNSLADDIARHEADLKAAKGWKKIAKRAKLRVEIASLKAAKWTADKALGVAIKVVAKLKKEIADHGVEANPKILALEAEIGVLEARLNNHICAAGAAAKLMRGANKIAKWISDHAGKLTGMFSVEKLKVSGRLSKLKKGDLADVSATVLFLSKRRTFNFRFGFDGLDDLVDTVTDTVTDDIQKDD